MLQSLISLDDKEIDVVLDVVARWCLAKGIDVDGSEGRRAITLAVDIVCNHKPADLMKALSARMEQ